MKKDYQTVYKMVEGALQNDVVWNLAVAYTQENDGKRVKDIVTEQYYQAHEGVEDFNLTVEQYLFSRLDDDDKYMKNAYWFESEEHAENEGFYWEDEICRWLKLDINK